MEQKQTPRYLFDRRTIGVMEDTKEVLDKITIGGIGGTGLTVASEQTFAKYLVIVTSILTLIVFLSRTLLSSIISRAIATNPINTSQYMTVTTPEPIKSPETVKPNVEIPAT